MPTLSAGRTLYLGKTDGLPDTRPAVRAVRYLNRRINDAVSAEDEAYFTWLSQAMASSVFPRDRLSSIEAGVVNFHQQIKQALPVTRTEAEPPAAAFRAG